MDEQTHLLLLIQRAQKEWRQIHESLLSHAGQFPEASAESIVLDYLKHPFAEMEQHLSRAENYLRHREFHAELSNEAMVA